jgi:GNAT superfamily N-acetyltransferase
MHFELDEILTDEILFYMENQEGEFLLDTHEGKVIDINNNDYEEEPDFNDDERFISLPEWASQDGYRLMEHFTAGLKNPIVRHELSLALNKNKGVFRFFKNTIEQYPEVEKLWFKFKEQEMKNEVIAWYNSLRETWGLQPIGIEPEDTSSLVLEDFTLCEGKETDYEKAAILHRLCIEELKDDDTCAFESIDQCDFSGDFFFTAETSNGDFSGFICGVKNSNSLLQIRQLEVKPEYRGLGLGKALLAKLLEKADGQKFTVRIDLPAGMEHFARALHLEEFKPCVQRFVRKR